VLVIPNRDHGLQRAACRIDTHFSNGQIPSSFFGQDRKALGVPAEFSNVNVPCCVWFLHQHKATIGCSIKNVLNRNWKHTSKNLYAKKVGSICRSGTRPQKSCENHHGLNNISHFQYIQHLQYLQA